MGAGLPANTGFAGAIHRVACFAAVRRLDKPAPTGNCSATACMTFYFIEPVTWFISVHQRVTRS
ncbi:hypothetical protein F3J44_10110 [Pantoea sp. Tr-811]|nr:hypothetical protein [Pantoea sp. Tr-811]